MCTVNSHNYAEEMNIFIPETFEILVIEYMVASLLYLRLRGS